MHITTWLDTLHADHSDGIDSDLKALGAKTYCFLTDRQVSHQIECLSGSLGTMRQNLRRAVIAYTLYTRQIDRIQDRVSKDFCREHCDRPPVGCCNAKHCDIFTPSDYFLYQPSPLAMQLAQAIGRLQKLEDGQGQAARAVYRGQYCPYLTDQGCTLRLFKSPRCTHYLCQTVGDDLQVRYGAKGEDFARIMVETSSRTLAGCADFTNPEVLTSAREMLTV
ncbi:hypothetical protein [Desulfovibrio sp. TomC]|uniref:hypothetical protein n=1 Tax=Desulfovibrio sp. TomC TaxID=1562888 RepID=UPI00057325E6|nr:hypothetical protein [Desulfovibrio sp. TomC]KHK00515.1 hypothetical protein NY78_4076 [Desulfovibrio sp. TomC]